MRAAQRNSIQIKQYKIYTATRVNLKFGAGQCDLDGQMLEGRDLTEGTRVCCIAGFY